MVDRRWTIALPSSLALRLTLALILAVGITAALSTALAGVSVAAGKQPPVLPLPSAPTPAHPLPESAPALRPAELLPPDLSIQYISRAPRYQRYCLDYSNNLPELCPGTEEAQHFPIPGEPMTLTAHIVQQGDISATSVGYTWTLDGIVKQVGVLPPLAAGESHDLDWSWLWQTDAHTVTLEVGDGAAGLELKEPTLINNTLSHRTDAHYLEILVHPYFVQAFAERQNLVGSYSFADWLQAQFAMLNQRLAAAVYPDTPQGIPDRIRIDVITPTVQVGGDNVYGDLAYDGRWTFRTERDYSDTSENEALESAERYAQTFAAGIDWGLLHELVHQLGVIDLYQLNVSPSAGNPLLDRDGLPLLSGFYFEYPDLMGGDDVRPYDGTYLSEHTAMALVQNSGYRRGYFGEYLFDVPNAITLRVLDNEGEPLAGVLVTGFQTEYNIIKPEAVFVGVTDSSGQMLIPNRATRVLTTATGHSLQPNVYNDIDVVGRNGQLLIKLSYGNSEEYRWLPITEMNKAAWRGQTALNLVVASHFPPIATHLGPARLGVRTHGQLAELSWTAVPDATGYNIYRALWPSYDSFERIATGLKALSYETTLVRSSRFAVTAVGPEGSESALSPIGRAELLTSPTGLVWSAPGNELLVTDAHTGALVQMLPPAGDAPARWVGRVGSEHMGLVGATSATPGPGDTSVVALSGGRVWVIDGKQQPLNWLGRVGERESPLNSPAGAVLLGDPLRVDVPATRPDPGAALVLPFDGSANDPAGAPPAAQEDMRFVAGRHGQGVRVDAGGRLQYDAATFNVGNGGIEFWFRPDWSGASTAYHVLAELGDPAQPDDGSVPGYRLQIAHQSGGLWVWATDFGDLDKAAWVDVAKWRAGEWHHIAATWDALRLNLFIDGRLAWAEALRKPITGAAPRLAVGSDLKGENAAVGIFDDLRVHRFPRFGTSDQMRIIVSDRAEGRLRVLDLAGNDLSTFPPPGIVRLPDPGALALGPDGVIWLLEHSSKQILGFRLQRNALQPLGALPGWIGDAPKSLAAGPGNLLAVADGNSVVMLDPARRSPVVGRWPTTNDGIDKPLNSPRALAFGPNGEVAVVEDSPARVRFIHDPVLGNNTYLPALMTEPETQP